MRATFAGLRRAPLQSLRHTRSTKAASPFHVEQLDVEDQRRIRWDHTACAAGTIAERGWDDERALATNLHRGDTFVPACDDSLRPDWEFERPAPVNRAVELLALGTVLIEPSGVMHDTGLAAPGRGAGADFAVDDLQSGGRGHGFPDLLSSCRERDSGCKNIAQRSDERKRERGTHAWQNQHGDRSSDCRRGG